VTLRALHAEWCKLSASLPSEEDERTVRINWTNAALVERRTKKLQPVASWSELTHGQAKYLLAKMREQSGDGPAYRARLLGEMAAELWGSDWDQWLATRLKQRFGVVRATDLSVQDARAMREELRSRIGRKREVELSTGEGTFYATARV
jgi:hypothetical protein